MKMPRWPLWLLIAATISGCASHHGAKQSTNFDRVHVNAHPKQITAAAEAIFALHGFHLVPKSNPQAIQLRKTTPLLFRPIKGGDATIWLILEPRASGWDVYFLPQPDLLYPGGRASRFQHTLTNIKQSAEKQGTPNVPVAEAPTKN